MAAAAGCLKLSAAVALYARNTTAMPAEITVRPMSTMAPLRKNSDMFRSEDGPEDDCRCVPAQVLNR